MRDRDEHQPACACWMCTEERAALARMAGAAWEPAKPRQEAISLAFKDISHVSAREYKTAIAWVQLASPLNYIPVPRRWQECIGLGGIVESDALFYLCGGPPKDVYVVDTNIQVDRRFAVFSGGRRYCVVVAGRRLTELCEQMGAADRDEFVARCVYCYIHQGNHIMPGRQGGSNGEGSEKSKK